ncbi:conserved hypothetical protein [Klebsiella pneumoniae]|nr:conserved hypothetical protein [Klebsiella pneumoniae]HBT1420735.1 hypothetical protein [Klebsiella pneumoniae]HBT5099025.1 hypothetical protein [Klebsiella pneumoniae]HBW0965414.1 hypothetical protein [Klebsiella pneumoniae]
MAIRLPAEVPALKSKKPARKQAFLNLAPLTGIAFASNWLIFKLNLNPLSVKTTKMTTNSSGLRKAGLSEPRIC